MLLFSDGFETYNIYDIGYKWGWFGWMGTTLPKIVSGIDPVGNNLMLALWHQNLPGGPRISLIASQDEAVSGTYRGLFAGRMAVALAQLKGEIEFASWDMALLNTPEPQAA